MNFTAKNINFSYDNLGIIASTLCMIHCIGTPFLFIAKACSTTCCADAPLWWKAIDYAFLIVSGVATSSLASSDSLSTRSVSSSSFLEELFLLFILLQKSHQTMY